MATKIKKMFTYKCKLIAKHNEEIVGVKQDNIVALTFHPELNNDKYYLNWLDNFIKEGENVRTL